MQKPESPVRAISGFESEDTFDRFHESLQELRQLRYQLHDAADYCETTFLNTKQKKILVENTKEYICRAVVTVVDHLGCVSKNLQDYLLFKNNSSSEAELRIDCLKQRMLACQQYVHKLCLSQVRWHQNFQTYSHRYISPTPPANLERPNGDSRECEDTNATKTTKKQEFEADGVPLFLYTGAHKPSLARKPPPDADAKAKSTNSTPVLPVRDGLSIRSKQQNPPFHFQLNHGLRRTKLRLVQSNDILALIRRSKRAADLFKGLHIDH